MHPIKWFQSLPALKRRMIAGYLGMTTIMMMASIAQVREPTSGNPALRASTISAPIDITTLPKREAGRQAAIKPHSESSSSSSEKKR